MKKLIILLIFFIPVLCFSQSIDTAVSKVAKTVADQEILTYAKSLDTVRVATVNTSNATPISADLLQPSTIITLYYISVIARNTGNNDVGWGTKAVLVRNLNGVYTIFSVANTDGTTVGFRGNGTLAKASWTISIVNKVPSVQITGVSGTPISWTVFESTK